MNKFMKILVDEAGVWTESNPFYETERLIGKDKFDGIFIKVDETSTSTISQTLWLIKPANIFVLQKKFQSGKTHNDIFEVADDDLFLLALWGHNNEDVNWVTLGMCDQPYYFKKLVFDTAKQIITMFSYDKGKDQEFKFDFLGGV